MKKSIEDTSEISPEILEEIQDAIEEVGDNIDDPYQDYMKKMQNAITVGKNGFIVGANPVSIK